ncbi:hypothetical protein BOTBODRAFT_190726 [Botryobasidium botryosum FD-172 SS1]|uniref:GmrSD restriction endonucleases N-terminal domain-containing protein n=1 Tax=Botryobasidium botryosum (strain FD-172 SS1) TaxID=930990 RepID=A0A067MEV5_BOTB1|nr:hypothetical protein BOTBODRAFT_190726 [Botryobasidium botryosum FD-172 SS1]
MADDNESSELSELSDDEELYNPRKKKTAPKPHSYKIKNMLKPPHTIQYSAESLYDMIHEGDIDLDPEYQRDVVWTEPKQIKLIDSMLRNFYMPPVIFRVVDVGDGNEKRICIDGKQRLTSIQRFMDGLIPHVDSITKKKYYFKGEGSGRQLLPPSYIKQLKHKQVVCIEYRELPDHYEREIFQRVQLGMALTPAERAQAISAPWADYIHDLLKHFFEGNNNLNDNVDWVSDRGKAFAVCSQMAFAIEKLPDYNACSMTVVEAWLQRSTPSESVKTTVHKVLHTFLSIARDPKDKRALQEPAVRVAPVEMIGIGLLIAHHRARLSQSELASAIIELRRYVRSLHTDIRSNSKVMKTIHQFVTTMVQGSSKSSTSSGARSRAANDSADRPKPAKKLKRDSSLSDSERPLAEVTRKMSASQPAPRQYPASQPPPQEYVAQTQPSNYPSSAPPPTKPRPRPYASQIAPPPPPASSSSSSQQQYSPQLPSRPAGGVPPNYTRVNALRAIQASHTRDNGPPPYPPPRRESMPSGRPYPNRSYSQTQDPRNNSASYNNPPPSPWSGQLRPRPPSAQQYSQQYPDEPSSSGLRFGRPQGPLSRDER